MYKAKKSLVWRVLWNYMKRRKLFIEVILVYYFQEGVYIHKEYTTFSEIDAAIYVSTSFSLNFYFRKIIFKKYR